MTRCERVFFLAAIFPLFLIPFILGGSIWWFNSQLKEIRELTYEIEWSLSTLKQYQEEILTTQAQINITMVNQVLALKHFNKELQKDMKTFILEEGK